MKSYRIHLIRHGLTQGNVEGQYVGSTDLPVIEAGLEELSAIKNEFEYPYASTYYCSPLLRCRQTLAFFYEGVDYEIIENLKEWDFGEFEGKTPSELKDNEEYKSWIANSSKHSPPGGESAEEFFERVNTAFVNLVYKVMKKGELDTVVVTHGGVIMSILSAFGLPERKYFDWMCGNGRGYTVKVTPSFFMRTSKIEVIGELPPSGASKMQGEQKQLFTSELQL